MSAQSDQNSAYITNVRTVATRLLNADDTGLSLSSEWNGFFGGAAQLETTAFVGANEGLVKTDVENVKAVLDAFHTWIDEAGQNRRAYLQKVRIIAGI